MLKILNFEMPPLHYKGFNGQQVKELKDYKLWIKGPS